ncbi:hypothetical protein ASD83_08060 [Devosia sp. Root685]|uniref:hypothetical protein n=1 Tax=Devosia sp. Root685 TaxID=1736587 RepID=UPI0006FEC8CD|nr:hypothetical protein [Devosia sp. Root685]KRB01445.1 hypothetical protein ASD83_08060 [Devosia sp. Root685]
MTTYRTLAIGEDAADAVTVGIERDAEGKIVAAVWWPSRGDVDADEVAYPSAAEALAAAEAAKTLHGFSEVAIMLQSDELWQAQWGELAPKPNQLTDEESFELARATEASRDA